MSTDTRWSTALALACLLAVILIPTTADPDLWGHTRFGLDVWQGHRVPLVDPYSFTQDRPQVYHEWLGAVLIALAYTAGGAAALLALKAGIAIGAFLLLSRALRTLNPPDALLVMALAVWSMVPIMFTIRPQLWSMLALLALIRLLQAGRVIWIPPLFALWANLHGGWVMGLGALGLWIGATAVDRIWRTRLIPWRLTAVAVASVLATLATPYGWRLWQQLGETVSLSRGDITEWQPLWDMPAGLAFPVVLIGGLVIGLSVSRRTRPAWPWLLVCASLFYSSVRVSRLVPIAMPAIILILIPWLAIWLPRSRRAASSPRAVAAGSLAAIVILTTAVAGRVAVFRCVPIVGEWKPDPGGIAVLRGAVDGGRVVTYFDWGEYAYWHLGPRLRVSMDGRRETIYSPRILAIHYSIYDGSADGSAWLLDRRPDYVWLKAHHQARRDWLATHGYRIDWQSDLSWIAVRDDLPRLSGPSVTASSGCFPGP